MATNFDDINLFGDKSLSDLFKQIHKNNKDTDKQIAELIEAIKPMISNPGSAVMLMPTVKDLIEKSDHVLIFSGDLGHYGGKASLMQLEKIRLAIPKVSDDMSLLSPCSF